MTTAVMTRERRYLQPGQIVVTDQPMAVTTILGSCVAVCLWDATKRIGGMNHFLLPIVAGKAEVSTRFGTVAMDDLLARLKALGARMAFLRARVFGGACMFEQMQSAAHLGRKNADLALEYLASRGIDIVQVEVGGSHGRKLVFHTDEGTVCLTSI